MTRIMWDSITPDAIPLSADLVAGYVNGNWPWAAAKDAFARWPHAAQVRIDVNGSDPHGASVLDVERGDATPSMAPGWIKARQDAKMGMATIYCNRDTLPEVQLACKGLKYYVWLATLDGNTEPGQGYAAVQAWGATQTGINADKSIVYDDSWHPAPQAPPATPMSGVVVMLPNGHSRGVLSHDGGKTWS